MEKRTVLAIVLSTLVFIVFQALNTKMNPVNTDILVENTTEISNIVEEQPKVIENNNDESSLISLDTQEFEEKDIEIKTNLLNVIIDTKGANVKSFLLNDFKVDVNIDENVDMVYNEISDNQFFNLKLADSDFNEVFEYKKLDDLTHEFSKTFLLSNKSVNEPAKIKLIKTYKFLPDEYMFELKISIQNLDNSIIPLNSNGSLYILDSGKQIGPIFKKLDRREDYRKLSIFNDGKRNELKVKKNSYDYNEKYSWVAVEGKFFTLAIVPENNNPSFNYSSDLVDGIPKSELQFNRSNLNSSYIEDTYKIYIGPKDNNILSKYNVASDNGWKLSDIKINKIISFWFLGMFFMWVLEIVNGFVNNFGFSIIIITVLIKIILYPFTKKSFDSMGKMQTVQPELKKLQDKYKDDSAKLNAATAELYKKEGINPLGGCLPMLLQMPIFITFYTLFNEYIGLRGATFIPGWIVDLSRPEAIYEFGFSLPILGWDAIRLLPIIYVASQLISMKFTQNSQASSSAQGANAMQTKMMTLGMPIMFFFIMYNQSSGLLLYWITQNVISSAQQIFSKKKSDKEHDLVLKDREEKKNKKKGRKN